MKIFKEKICEICNNSYIPNSGFQKVCSSECRYEVSRIRQLKRYHEIRKYDTNYMDSLKRYAKEYRKRNRKYIDNIKKQSQCKLCGYDDCIALVFHHRDPSEKEVNIPTLCGNRCSMKKVISELNKCNIVCQNCHTILHLEEMGEIKMKLKRFYVNGWSD